ncbi:hypothetical protein [Burkholderia vietnamiensis]|nr:hypothetical protein [Burkholderia vietnamiensis]MDN7668133.1 hypothetical protein [Burkholderia vietnamiensis]
MLEHARQTLALAAGVRRTMRTRRRTGSVRPACASRARAARCPMAWALLKIAATPLAIRSFMNKLDLLRRALSALFAARFIELQRSVRRR